MKWNLVRSRLDPAGTAWRRRKYEGPGSPATGIVQMTGLAKSTATIFASIPPWPFWAVGPAWAEKPGALPSFQAATHATWSRGAPAST